MAEASDKIEVFPKPSSGSLLAYINVPITCSRVTYTRKLAQDIRAMEASFRLAEIKGLQDNQWYKQDRLTKLAE